MKKIISLLLLAAISLSLSSCMFMLGSYNLIPSVDMNGKEKYIPCEEDFESTDIPLGSASFYESFLPTKSCLYYYSLTNKGEATLYRADKNGTERIAKSGDDKLSGYILDDWIIKKEKSNVFFTAYDDETFASKLFCYDENEKSYQEIFSTKEGYELWDICGGKFVYMPYNDSYEDDESYPYCLYPIVSADLESGESTRIISEKAVYFKLIEERIFFITYSDEALFEVFSCDTDGKDMKSLGSISVDYNPKYAYIEGYHISEEYVTLWGDMGVGDSATDIAVLSLENGEVTEHSFDLYSRTFAVCNGYGFITFTREYYDPIADPDISPMENEGIYKIDLITGEKELISNELAFNSELFAFDENCVYAISYSVNQISNQYTYHISRVRAGEDATLVYNYKQ